MAAPQQEPSLSVGLLGASGSLLTKVNGSTMPFLHPVINDPWLRAKPFFGLYLLLLWVVRLHITTTGVYCIWYSDCALFVSDPAASMSQK